MVGRKNGQREGMDGGGMERGMDGGGGMRGREEERGGQTGGVGACCSELHNSLQPPDSLMLASIEARLRRLNKMAQRSAVGLSSLLPTMQQRGGVEGGGNGGGGGEGTTGSRGEQELPEWKFFNKVQCVGGEGGRKIGFYTGFFFPGVGGGM